MVGIRGQFLSTKGGPSGLETDDAPLHPILLLVIEN